jgi:hypothetical protein
LFVQVLFSVLSAHASTSGPDVVTAGVYNFAAGNSQKRLVVLGEDEEEQDKEKGRSRFNYKEGRSSAAIGSRQTL